MIFTRDTAGTALRPRVGAEGDPPAPPVAEVVPLRCMSRPLPLCGSPGQ
jgi:hypothetical protein